MKALNEYFLMVVFTLLLNKVHVFATFMFNLDSETMAPKALILREPLKDNSGAALDKYTVQGRFNWATGFFMHFVCLFVFVYQLRWHIFC